jgi:hypothetical protein
MHALRKITAEINLDEDTRKEVQAIRVLLEKISK